MQLDMILSTIRVPGASGTEKKKKNRNNNQDHSHKVIINI